MKKETVAVGLSGGVDSALSAALLQQAGYKVTGVYLECYRESGCRSDQDRQDALAVALHLGIPFQSLDFRQAYREQVLAYLYREYQQGKTPNPDLWCNREIKFGLFYQWAMKQHFALIATGHYAQIKQQRLYTSVDAQKDQTYFLSLVSPELWQRVLFPIGHLTKIKVREQAEQLGLPVAHKKDSTGICFVGEVGMRDFLARQIPATPGEVVHEIHGKKVVIGSHQGLAYYTLGQRHGLALQQTTANFKPFYVIGKDWQHNQLLVATKDKLYYKSFNIKPLTLNARLFSMEQKKQLLVRIRHQGELVPVVGVQDNCVQLAAGVFAPAPGQFAVFYERDPKGSGAYCLGAAEIVYC